MISKIISLMILALGLPAIFGQISDNFKGYVGDPDGVAFVASNGKYLSEVHYWRGVGWYVVAAKSSMDAWCKFLVVAASDSTFYLKCHSPNHYVQVIQRGTDNPFQALECWYHPDTNSLDINNEFKSYSVDNGAKLAIRVAWPRNIIYPNRVFLRLVQSDREYIQPMDAFISIHNKFEFKSASTFPAQFELLDTKFTNIAALRDAVHAAPQVAKQTDYLNDGSATIEHNFGLTTTVAQSETTTWEHAFGASLETGFSAGIPMVGDLSLSLTLSYNFKTGGSSSETNTQEVSESFKVTIPPFTKATAQLMIRKADNVALPFVARFRKTRYDENGNKVETIINESGTWRGVRFLSSNIQVTTKKIGAEEHDFQIITNHDMFQ